MNFVVGLQSLPLRAGKKYGYVNSHARHFSLSVISFRVRTSCTETQAINVTASPVSPPPSPSPLVGSPPAAARSKPPLSSCAARRSLWPPPPPARREEGGGMAVRSLQELKEVERRGGVGWMDGGRGRGVGGGKGRGVSPPPPLSLSLCVGSNVSLSHACILPLFPASYPLTCLSFSPSPEPLSFFIVEPFSSLFMIKAHFFYSRNLLCFPFLFNYSIIHLHFFFLYPLTLVSFILKV